MLHTVLSTFIKTEANIHTSELITLHKEFHPKCTTYLFICREDNGYREDSILPGASLPGTKVTWMVREGLVPACFSRLIASKYCIPTHFISWETMLYAAMLGIPYYANHLRASGNNITILQLCSCKWITGPRLLKPEYPDEKHNYIHIHTCYCVRSGRS